MSKLILIVLGILLIWGCADVSKENQFQTGCSESSESTPENVYVPPAPAPAPTVTYWTQQIGTNQSDYARSITTNSVGDIFITGVTNGTFDNNTSAGNGDFFVAKYDNNGVNQWTKQGGTYLSENGKDLAIDSSNNIYLIGSTQGNLDGNSSAGNYDIFFIKYDISGDRKWTKQIGSSADDFGYSIGIDNSNNIYITGFTEGSISGSNAGGRDGFLAKYDTNGNQIWIKQFGTSSDEGKISYAEFHISQESELSIDSSGNIFIVGTTLGTLGDSNYGRDDIYLIKFNNSGNVVWTKQIGSDSIDFSDSIVIDNNNDIYLTGFTWGNLDGNTNGGSEDVFITKYSNSGVRQWTKLLDSEYTGTADWERAFDIAVDGSNNIYITGFTDGDFGNKTSRDGLRDLFVAKYNSNGEKKWVKQIIGSSNITIGRGITVDNSNNIYITGYTNGSLDGKTSYGSYDTFILKYDTDGNRQ